MFDTTAPAAPADHSRTSTASRCAYTKRDSGTGAGTFANSTLYIMSRAGAALFGAGDLDEVALYNRALSAATIDEHYASYGTNRRPVARFTITPNRPEPNQTVTFNGSSSSDPDGTITKYEWDLDGNGSYETNTGTTPTATKTYTAERTGRREPAGDGQPDRHRHRDHTSLSSATRPDGRRSRRPRTRRISARRRSFNASASTDPDGTIAKYEWDLDGNGTYETDTGTTKTTTAAVRHGRHHRPSACASPTTAARRRPTTLPVTVNSGGVSNYGDAVLDTAGLVDYWRMGEPPARRSPTARARARHGVDGTTFGVPGAVPAIPTPPPASTASTTTAAPTSTCPARTS